MSDINCQTTIDAPTLNSKYPTLYVILFLYSQLSVSHKYQSGQNLNVKLQVTNMKCLFILGCQLFFFCNVFFTYMYILYFFNLLILNVKRKMRIVKWQMFKYEELGIKDQTLALTFLIDLIRSSFIYSEVVEVDMGNTSFQLHIGVVKSSIHRILL